MHGDRVTKLKNGSVVWKSIGQGWDLLKENSSWNLGDGRSIDFWHDDWLSIGPLRDWVQGPLTPEEDSRKVNSVVDLGNWDLSSLSIPLPSSLTNRILTMIPPPQDVAADLLIPKFVDHKGFRLQKAYRAQLMYSPSHPDLSWIWKGRCEQKLKFFV